MIQLQKLEQSLKHLGIHYFKTLAISEIKGYGSIYDFREEMGWLSGLEPLYSDENALHSYLEGYNTLLGMAIPYGLLPKIKEPEPGACSRVSIMAWEWDYHQVVKNLIQRLELPENSYKLHVDSGPLPERQLAMQMGLAKPGRSQMLLHHQLGTGFYLAFLLLNLDEAHMPEGFEKGVEINEPQVAAETSTIRPFELANACLNCRKCQTHCPSGALFGEHDFDGSRCISALTQKKGSLTPKQMKTIGMNLYGCDHCQLSCPANSPLFKTYQMRDPSFDSSTFADGECVVLNRETHNAIHPEKLLYLSQKAFKRDYGHMGFSWRGVKTNKRNALINMGNSGNIAWKNVIETFLATEPQDASLEEVGNWALKAIEASSLNIEKEVQP